MAYTPGSESTEWAGFKWIGLGATLIIAIVGALTAYEILPQEGFWASLVSGALAVAHSFANYAKSRGLVKAADSANSGTDATNP